MAALDQHSLPAVLEPDAFEVSVVVAERDAPMGLAALDIATLAGTSVGELDVEFLSLGVEVLRAGQFVHALARPGALELHQRIRLPHIGVLQLSERGLVAVSQIRRLVERADAIRTIVNHTMAGRGHDTNGPAGLAASRHAKRRTTILALADKQGIASP